MSNASRAEEDRIFHRRVLESAIRIGLLPMVNPEKIISLGNASSTGANMILLSKRYWERSAEIAATLEHLELSGHADFFDKFIEEMNFPTENLW